MIVLIAKNVVAEKNEAEFLQLAEKMVEETRKEPGCIYYDFVRDTNEKGVYYFVEKYVDQAAVEAHNNSEYFLTYIPRMRELRDDTHLTRGEVLSFE